MSNDYIVQRRIKHQKLLRKARRIEIAFIRLYKLLKLAVVICIIYWLYRLANANLWILPNDIYVNKNTTRLEIIGNNIVKDERIIGMMSKVILDNKPIYRINPSKISKNIETLEPIKKAYVRRFWNPARLIVMIEEVNPVLTIAPSETAPDIAAFDLSGVMIPREYLPLDKKFSTTKILSYGTKGDDYTKWDKKKIETLYKLSKITEQYSGEKISYIDLRQPNNIFIGLKSVKIRLGELDEGAFERIKAIYDILPRLKTMKEKIKYVDLSWRDSRYLKLDKPKPVIQENTPDNNAANVQTNTQKTEVKPQEQKPSEQKEQKQEQNISIGPNLLN